MMVLALVMSISLLGIAPVRTASAGFLNGAVPASRPLTAPFVVDIFNEGDPFRV